jgi:hypothetical protein
LNARLDLDLAASAIELDDACKTVHVDQGRARRELLTTHGMSAARNTDSSSIASGRANDGLHCIY